MADRTESDSDKTRRLLGLRDQALLDTYDGIQSKASYGDVHILTTALYEAGKVVPVHSGLRGKLRYLEPLIRMLFYEQPTKPTQMSVDWSSLTATNQNSPVRVTNHLNLIRTPDETGVARPNLSLTSLESAIQYGDYPALRLSLAFTPDADISSIHLTWPSTNPRTIYFLTQQIPELVALGDFVEKSYLLRDAFGLLVQSGSDEKTDTSQLTIDLDQAKITYGQQIKLAALTPKIIDSSIAGLYYGDERHSRRLRLENMIAKRYSVNHEFFYNPRTQTFVRLNPGQSISSDIELFLLNLPHVANYEGKAIHLPKSRDTFSLDEFKNLANATLGLRNLLSP